MSRHLVAHVANGMGRPDGSMDWADLGRRIRAAAEQAVATPNMEEAAIDLRRLLLDSVSPPLTSHPSRTIRDLLAEDGPDFRTHRPPEAGQ